MDEHIQEVIQLFDGTRATFLESIKSIVDEMQNSITDWETFETNLCYAPWVMMPKYLLLK